jgi:stearoyl-CoA desaturase (delta-9 desaturase)
VADGKTLEAIIANRYEVMAGTPSEMRAPWQRVTACGQGQQRTARWVNMNAGQGLAAPRRRQDPAGREAAGAEGVGDSPKLAKLVAMREELRQLWTRTNVSAEQLVPTLQAWCRRPRTAALPRCRSSR